MSQTVTKEQASTTTNQISLTGRLGADPQVIKFENSSLCEINVYCTEPGRKDNYYTVNLWNQVGNIAAKYLKKGDQVTVRGEFRFDNWTDKQTGEARRKLKLAVNDRFGLDLPAKSKEQTASAPKPVPAPKPVINVPAEEISDAEWDNIRF